jgi:hypothetical protein
VGITSRGSEGFRKNADTSRGVPLMAIFCRDLRVRPKRRVRYRSENRGKLWWRDPRRVETGGHRGAMAEHWERVSGDADCADAFWVAVAGKLSFVPKAMA